MLLAFAGLTGGCYLVSVLLALHWGFLQNGGIVEFLLHNSSGALPYLVGVTFCVLAYFVSRYTVVRYGIAEHSCVWLPKDLRPLVQELGGLQNILAIENDGVQVRNSKRVNTLLLEGELKEDRFITDDPQIQTLKRISAVKRVCSKQKTAYKLLMHRNKRFSFERSVGGRRFILKKDNRKRH